jgi:hypothetical protein
LPPSRHHHDPGLQCDILEDRDTISFEEATMGDYDDERPSWREIDKRRDGSSHTRGEKQQRAEQKADRWNTGRHKEALEKLFKGDKGTPDHDKLYNKIHKSYGTSTFVSTIQKYIAKYGPPEDASTLLLLLDSKDGEVMVLSMDKLSQIYGSVSAREKEDIRRKLSILALTEKSPELRERASELGEDMKSRP